MDRGDGAGDLDGRGQPVQVRTNRSPLSGLAFAAHHCAVDLASNRRGCIRNERPDRSQA